MRNCEEPIVVVEAIVHPVDEIVERTIAKQRCKDVGGRGELNRHYVFGIVLQIGTQSIRPRAPDSRAM